MGFPEISIIIPVYNAGSFLRESLDSVFRQSFSDFEIILVNDGSTDESSDIINDYQTQYQNKVRVLSQGNSGQSTARNEGLRLASGKYIAFIDADDLITDDYLECLYNAAEKNRAQISYCSYKAYDNISGETVYLRITEDWYINFDENHSHVFQYSPCCRLVRKDFIDRYHFRFGEGEQMEDGPYCMMVDLLADRKAVVNEIKYYYRKRTESTTGNNKKRNSRPVPPFNCLKQAVETVRNNTDDPVKLQMLEYCSIKIMAGWATTIYSNADKDSRREICDYCRKQIEEWFPNINDNPYFRVSKLKGLPLSHRVATRLFVAAYRTNMLYAFSLASSRVLRIKQR